MGVEQLRHLGFSSRDMRFDSSFGHSGDFGNLFHRHIVDEEERYYCSLVG